MTWCDLWQWDAQSPGLSATNSIARIAPTGTLVVVSGQRALLGTQPPSVQLTPKLWPWMWMRWLVIERFAIRIRTRSLRSTTRGSITGNTRLLQVQRLKLVISATLGVAAPGSTS